MSEAWKPLPGQPKEKLGTIHPSLVKALDDLLHRSFNITRVRIGAEGKKVLVAIDCRPTLALNNCWGQDGLSCARYSATIVFFGCSFKFQGSSCFLALPEG